MELTVSLLEDMYYYGEIEHSGETPVPVENRFYPESEPEYERLLSKTAIPFAEDEQRILTDMKIELISSWKFLTTTYQLCKVRIPYPATESREKFDSILKKYDCCIIGLSWLFQPTEIVKFSHGENRITITNTHRFIKNVYENSLLFGLKSVGIPVILPSESGTLKFIDNVSGYMCNDVASFVLKDGEMYFNSDELVIFPRDITTPVTLIF